MATPAQSIAEPIHLGRYQTSFRLAQGGMAEVYVGRLVGEGGFEKPVAIKRMLPHLAADERFVGMFLDEGRMAASISSPHVVSTLDLGRADDDSLFLVMELVVGVPLSVLMRGREPIPVALAAEIIAQAALGLHDAHEARTVQGEWLRIVHRDVSPQNVLVDVTGRARITDFGVARAIERVTQTESGEVKGKLAYFAPEQARSQPLDCRADVFALAIVGWELLAGRRLFVGEGPADTLSRVLEMPVPRLDAIRPDVPTTLADAIARALERDTHARTESANVLAREIRAAAPGGTAADVASLVRARGGETLRSLEEGLRSQSAPPKIAPARVSSVATASPIASPVAPRAVPVAPSSGRWVWALVVGALVAGALGVVIARSIEPPTVRILPLPTTTATRASAPEPAPQDSSAAPSPIATPSPEPTTVAPTPSAVPAEPRTRSGRASTSHRAPEPTGTHGPRALRGMDDFEADMAH